MTTPFCRVRPCPGYEVITTHADLPVGFAQVVRCRRCDHGKRFATDLDAASAAGTNGHWIDVMGERVAVARVEPGRATL